MRKFFFHLTTRVSGTQVGLFERFREKSTSLAPSAFFFETIADHQTRSYARSVVRVLQTAVKVLLMMIVSFAAFAW